MIIAQFPPATGVTATGSDIQVNTIRRPSSRQCRIWLTFTAHGPPTDGSADGYLAFESVTPAALAAAWLHDVGYADAAKVTGFHPLDGAGFLTAQGWPVRIAGLVAYHSGARFVAAARGLGEAFAVYPDEGGLMADALTYADQTVGPTGDRVTPDQRYTDGAAGAGRARCECGRG